MSLRIFHIRKSGFPPYSADSLPQADPETSVRRIFIDKQGRDRHNKNNRIRNGSAERLDRESGVKPGLLQQL